MRGVSIFCAAALLQAACLPTLAAETAVAPPATDIQGSGTLSDKLSNTGGVIHPKSEVDPGIKVTPPTSGTTMPVIPPPGAPGGDPDVQPK